MKLEDLTPDKYQRSIIDDFTPERTIVVTGVAGSGKSLTLLKKAKQVSAISDSYAIIVYTKSLKQFFAEELAEIDPEENHIYYLHEWKHCDKPHYKYLFIDECQDFNSEEIADFASHGDYLWLFGDDNQAIMSFKPTENAPGHSIQSVSDTIAQLKAEHQDLCINHRLTIENAALAESIRPNSDLTEACYRHGNKPMIIPCTDISSELDMIINLIRSASLTNVGILTHYNSGIRTITDYFASKGIPVEWKTSDNDDNIDFSSSNPKVMTVHSAKGLQFSTVFVPFCQKPSYDDERLTLYVATTRPLDRLILPFSGKLTDFLPPIESELYAN